MVQNATPASTSEWMDSDVSLYQLRRKWWPLCTPQITMFNLMSNCCNWISKLQQPMRKVTVLVVGLDNAGKTSTIRGMLGVPPGEVGPTHGCVRTELAVENFLVTLLDMGGGPEARENWRDHYGEAHGVIFVVDSSDRARIKEVKDELADILKQPRMVGKPLLVLANKQDKIHALLGSELIEILSLEKLVNQSRSLCHIEPCSAFMDLRRWSDRKTLRGLRWLLRAVSLDYAELCSRIVRDVRQPYGLDERERRGKAERSYSRVREERIFGSKGELQKEKSTKGKSGSTLQPIRDILKTENTLKKKLKKTKKAKVKINKENVKNKALSENGEDDAEGAEVELEHGSQKEKASSALLPRKRVRLKQKAKVKEETLDHPESLDNDDPKLPKEKGARKKKKKTIKAKRKNKINTEAIPAAYTQSVDLSSTFELYRKAILALKARQEQEQEVDQGLER
ncbi:ADP-ribosylation factor-like protein 13A isoform X2 [Denticeps clupeoides]|uniref:ADP-ribosylation factor-like protein 13A isoform X2 n=1 Tax=Denticeps clupeoides TaxID=299321 RepID=UPI0010A4A325|nr:ADP-ribosylation factor-like protein 13A isoform X2 [Denticeps clupeoides]